jgi:NADPH:quinone reductase-like Zn-dependent oxidoreductase
MARIVRFYETGGPEVLKIEDVEIPPPGPQEVTIAVKALGLNRAEAMFREGQYLERAELPARLGYEAAGRVSAVGEDVKDLRPGDDVSVIPPLSITRYGTYGEVATFPAELVVKNPPGLGWKGAAALWMQSITAYGGLIELANLGTGDSVIITAASSSVGLAAIQIARWVGATAIAATRARNKEGALLAAGAAHVIVTREDDLVGRVQEITGGAGARVVFDPVGGPGFLKLIDAVSPGGILIEYGALDRTPVTWPLLTILAKSLTLRGYRYKETAADPARIAKARRFVLGGVASGALQPIIAAEFSFDRIVEAHRYLESNEQFGKIVVTV